MYIMYYSVYQSRKKSGCVVSNSSANIFESNFNGVIGNYNSVNALNSSRINFGAIPINGNSNSNRLRYSIRETKEINCINSNNNNSNINSNSSTNVTSRSCRSNIHDINSSNNNNGNASLTIENAKHRKSTAINMNSSSITKPLELNMAYLEEIVRQHQKDQTQRYTELNPIQETSESGRQEEKKNTNYITDLKQRSYFSKKIPTINNIITKSLASFNQTIESTSPPKLTNTSVHSSNNAFKHRITNPNYNAYNTETSSTSSTLLTSLTSTITPISNMSNKPPYISKYPSITNSSSNENSSTFNKYMSNFNSNNSLKKTLANCNTTTNMSFNNGNTTITGVDSSGNKNGIDSTRNPQDNSNNTGYPKNRGCIGFKTSCMLNMSYSTTNYDKIKTNDYCIQYPRGRKQK